MRLQVVQNSPDPQTFIPPAGWGKDGPGTCNRSKGHRNEVYYGINCASPLKKIKKSFVSVPCLFMARQVYFPSRRNRMLAVFVVFRSTVVFLISAVYIGGVPVTLHEILKPGNAVTSEVGNNILGEAKKSIFKINTGGPHIQLL